MKKFNLLCALMAVLGISACVHDGSKVADNSSGHRQPAQQLGGNPGRAACHDGDENFRERNTDHGPNALTVWSLQEMADKHQEAELNELFNHHGLSLDCLPVGYAAGAGAHVLGFEAHVDLGQIGFTNPFEKLLEAITGHDWAGKIFLSQSADLSNGVNRIRSDIFDLGFRFVPHQKAATIIPQGHFTTRLVKYGAEDYPKELVPNATSDVVLLNYALPIANPEKPTMVEHILEHVPVYDVMVAVKGKYGPIYVGETWFGHYDEQGNFVRLHKDPTKLIARYFLDFNPQALAEQQKNHWFGNDGTTEIPSYTSFSDETTQSQLTVRP